MISIRKENNLACYASCRQLEYTSHMLRSFSVHQHPHQHEHEHGRLLSTGGCPHLLRQQAVLCAHKPHIRVRDGITWAFWGGLSFAWGFASAGPSALTLLWDLPEACDFREALVGSLTFGLAGGRATFLGLVEGTMSSSTGAKSLSPSSLGSLSSSSSSDSAGRAPLSAL